MHKARRSAYCFIVDCVGSCSCYYCYCCCCHFCCYDCRSFIYWSHKRVKSTTYIMSWPNWSFTSAGPHEFHETGLPSSIEKWHIISVYVIWAVSHRGAEGILLPPAAVWLISRPLIAATQPSRILHRHLVFCILTAAKCILHFSVAIAQAWTQSTVQLHPHATHY